MPPEGLEYHHGRGSGQGVSCTAGRFRPAVRRRCGGRASPVTGHRLSTTPALERPPDQRRFALRSALA
ncbi:hypothetical protein CU044_1881 [Streptomyces sp. L-9-10]|nr:hypothetical protein CU044_1881 [Streptomyces sp. L-9-10]